MKSATDNWRPSGRFFFRFAFLFLGATSILCWDTLTFLLYRAFSTAPYDFGAFYGFLRAPMHWLDAHIFHTGYNPATHMSYPGDNHFGVLFYLVLLPAALIGALLWSILDKKRPNYNRLHYWFGVYLRYTLAITMFGYGLDKVIPIQMTYPGVVQLLLPLGYSNRFSLFWDTMGVAPGYQIVTGTVELLGALLLFSRRTIVLGYILTLAALINVVSLNIFFNVTVKLFSTQLLLYTVYLLYPYSRRLINLFFAGASVSLATREYAFPKGPLRNTFTALLIGIPSILFIIVGSGMVRHYGQNKRNARLEKNYEVVTFVAKDIPPPLTTDTIPPLPADTLRWKHLLITYSNYTPTPFAVIWNMQDDKDWYYYHMDTVTKRFTLIDTDDSTRRYVFNYSNPAKTQLFLTGKWKDKDVKILMNDVPIDSMWLNRDQIKLVRD
jgi:hypothetical protein